MSLVRALSPDMPSWIGLHKGAHNMQQTTVLSGRSVATIGHTMPGMDKRYIVVCESQPTYFEHVLYFCGREIGRFYSFMDALEAAGEHQDDRLAPRTRGVMAPVMQGVRA